MKLAGWGRFPAHEARVSAPHDLAALTQAIRSGRVIARGLGRAYGDSAIGSGETLDMRRFDRMLSFDAASGLLVAEAGVSLADVIATFLPRGWFPAVTPGTRFVTLGGMVASDVHGKNHHRDGSVRSVIAWIDLVSADGSLVRCSRGENADLFDWTLGGMGLTGVIVRVAMRLRRVESGYIRQTTHVAPNLQSAIAVFEGSLDATYSVAWIDCLARGSRLGRALVYTGEHATAADLPAALSAAPFTPPPRSKRRVPFDLPGWALNRLSVGAFNELYYQMGRARQRSRIVDWDSYFYPLDTVLGWNRIYGRRGLLQFQCVLPLERSAAGLSALLEATSAAGAGSFLAVLKRFGEQQGSFAFPMPGYTLALDFPVSRRTLRLMERLDAIVLAHGGRFYLAKDARLTAGTLRSADPRSVDFARMRRQRGLDTAFGSQQSERLEL